jgi:hypothetical protein
VVREIVHTSNNEEYIKVGFTFLFRFCRIDHVNLYSYLQSALKSQTSSIFQIVVVVSKVAAMIMLDPHGCIFYQLTVMKLARARGWYHVLGALVV